jgi:hypothetical protein
MATTQRPHRKRPSVAKRTFVVATMALAATSFGGQGRHQQSMVVVVEAANPAASAAMGALKNLDYRYFVAGGTCAAFSHGITTPIDVVKTKLQANPEVSSNVISISISTALFRCWFFATTKITAATTATALPNHSRDDNRIGTPIGEKNL